MDEEIATQISKLPNEWKVTTSHDSKVKTNKNLEYCTWGIEKEADNLVYFEDAILKMYPPHRKKKRNSTPCWSFK